MVRPGELYHGPAFIIPGGRRRFPRVVTVHDLFVFTHPRLYPWRFGLWLRWAARRSCRAAERIIVPSEAIAQEMAVRRLASPEKIRVIAEAPDDTHNLWDEASLEAGGQVAGIVQEATEPLIVTVGTLDPRKDPATARVAYLELVQRLQVAPVAVATSGAPAQELFSHSVDWLWLGRTGSAPDPTPEPLRRSAAEAGFRTPGHVPKETVRAALRAATVYVTCARSEGFGLPLVEAMVAGCPIVASDVPVHHEVAGDAALYFPPGDASALAAVLHRLLSKPALRQRLIERGRRRQADFRWSAAAEATLAAYREAATAKNRDR
jgi:glycosyltransferase involved in cell wall biosynthesis